MAADPQTLAQSHSAEVWAAFCGALTLIIALVTVLYNRLNKDNLDLWKQVELHRKTLEGCKVEMGKMSTEISTLKQEDEFENQELDRLYTTIRGISDRLTRLEAEHNTCIPRRIAMRGEHT
jgi:hypothetical protein